MVDRLVKRIQTMETQIGSPWIPSRRRRILGPETSPSLGDNLNGPGPIRVPEWVSHPLGKFYLYFSHHRGQFIRLAYAENPYGPWKIHTPGVLRLEEVPQLQDHLASPDVIVDHKKRQIRMYFHGRGGETWWQESAMALSDDGLHFRVLPGVIGPFYLRTFPWRDQWLGIARDGDRTLILLKSTDGLQRFRWVRPILPGGRHVAVWIQNDVLWIFYTRIGDAPERILCSRAEMRGEPEFWNIPDGHEVMRPQHPWEGSEYPIEPSSAGPALAVHQLRDPGLLEHDGSLYLYYSGAGETCLGVTQLKYAASTSLPF